MAFGLSRRGLSVTSAATWSPGPRGDRMSARVRCCHGDGASDRPRRARREAASLARAEARDASRPDDEIIEEALSGYLLERLLDKTQARSNLSEDGQRASRLRSYTPCGASATPLRDSRDRTGWRESLRLVTAEGRSVIDAPTQSGRQACVESVEDFHDGEIDVTLVRAHTVRHTPIRATVAVVLKREGAEERWKLYLVHRHRGWLVDDAQPVEARADSAR
jgi:hypothetical protein